MLQLCITISASVSVLIYSSFASFAPGVRVWAIVSSAPYMIFCDTGGYLYLELVVAEDGNAEECGDGCHET